MNSLPFCHGLSLFEEGRPPEYFANQQTKKPPGKANDQMCGATAILLIHPLFAQVIRLNIEPVLWVEAHMLPKGF
ncbi:MAG: hypothetical protein ACOCPW_01090 [Marinilabiliaceae bacterium]